MKIEVKAISEQPISKLKLFNKILTDKYFEGEHPTISERILLVCDWNDIGAEEVEKWHVKTINKVVAGIIEVVKSYQPEAPQERFKNYTHRSDYLKMSVGHWKHIELIDIEETPKKALALFYIEEGLYYGHEEKKGGRTIVINPLEERAEKLKELVKLDKLIDLLAFFLNTSELLSKNWVSSLIKLEAMKRRATPMTL